MTYEELKNKNNYYVVHHNAKRVYFEKYTDAIEYILANELQHRFYSVWTDEFGYMHETPGYF